MADKNSEQLERLLATFRIEADEHVKAMSSGLLALEKLAPGEPQQQQMIEIIFREAHSLKGAARAVKVSQIEAICQPFESVFAALRDGKMSLSTPLADLLHRAVSLVETLANSSAEGMREHQGDVSTLVRQLDRVLTRASRGPQSMAGAKTPPAAPTAAPQHTHVGKPPASSTATTVRISTKKLDAVMRLSEEMLACRLSAAQRAKDMGDAARELSLWRKRSTEMQALLRPLERNLSSSQKMCTDIRKLLNYFADEQIRVRALEDQLTEVSRVADRDRRVLSSMTDDLQQRVREMQLLPCITLLDIFARQARELAREQGKEVDLSVQGSDIEVDRRLLDEIKDPLIHLVRNCIDHGIETPSQRQTQSKPTAGNISISVAQKDSGKIIIKVTDDGAGIDIQRLKSISVERGILTPEEAEGLSKTQAQDLIFRSGLSTSALITDMSGRGLGMAIVRDKIEQLGGTIEVTSETNVGTQFQIVLPVNLATFRGTLITVTDRIFIVPSANVDRVVRITPHTIHSVNNRDTVGIDNQALPLIWLSDIFNLPRTPTTDANVLAVILGRGTSRVAFRVDEVIGEQEVLVKGLGPQLRRVKNITSASVLGNGQVVPVLNVLDLLEAAQRQPIATAARTEPDAAAQKSILVAEDSITSRSLMKNILETAGFRVVTAVDGIDAFTTLKTQTFDLVVSDVDMPRMNGFDLTAKLRADKELSELPVVLVTTLDSREDRERGIDAGANAYIVKSSFDQSNLLEVIHRLL